MTTQVDTVKLSEAKSDGVVDRLRQRRRQRRLANEAARGTSRTLRGWALVRRYIVLTIILIILVGPILLPLFSAFKTPGEPVFGAQSSIIPQEWSLESFRRLFERTDILGSILNSAIVVALCTASNLVLSTMGGYMLSRRGWNGRTICYFIVLCAMMFPFESIMLSLFSMMVGFGLYDSLLGVWLPTILYPFQLLFMRAAFLAIPDEIEDAALIDGAGEFRRFISVMLPQVKGSLTVVGLITFITVWSDFLLPLLILPSPDHQTLMLTLNAIQNSPQGTSYQLVLAGAVIVLLPPVLLFMFTQRYFFRGIEAGGLKF